MTDLLGLLSGIHRAVTECGEIHLTVTDVEGMTGCVDRYSNTVHISPGLTLPEMLHVLADAVQILAPPPVAAVVPLAVGGGDPGNLVPKPRVRHLSMVAAENAGGRPAASVQVLRTGGWTTPA